MTRAQELKAHIWPRDENDFYVEPAWVSKRLFEVELFVEEIWDPACGFGTIVQSARDLGHSAFGSDIVNRGIGGVGVMDFFDHKEAPIANIVTNPPFNIAPAFALHALKIARLKVAIIFPTARLNAAHWLHDTPLARVWLLTPRPSMPPGRMIAGGQKAQGGKMDYCWLIFEQGYSGPSLGWMRRDL
jgi:hypothetical protein